MAGVICVSDSRYFDTKMCRLLSIVSCYYLLISTVELLAHKFVMHEWKSLGIAPAHIEHHLNVKQNMRLKKPDHNRDNEFSWFHIMIMNILVTPITWPLFRHLRVSCRSHIKIMFILSMIVGVLWNNLHNAMHNDEKYIPLSHGPPKLLKNSTISKLPFYNTWLQNHKLHHIFKKRKTNFCIIFLGADRVFGTAITNSEIEQVLRDKRSATHARLG